MTAIKLVNWHYFVNETIRLRGSTLITGDNGSGKSTIFDAIQMVLIADQRKVRFNISAHDETNRDLKGYLRCRTGRDDPAGGEAQGYLRSGDFTSYVALEFTDTVRNERFVLGVAVDTLGGEPDTPQFFRYSGDLDEALFVEGNRPRSVGEFKALLKLRRAGEVFASVGSYRTALKAQLGHLDERFFTLILKGLAFHPITDIRKFVYDYLLDAREVRIDAMLENFRQYRQYDTLVQQTKEKLARLTVLMEKLAAKRDLEKTATIQQYVILRAAREAVQEELARLRAEHEEKLRDKAAAAVDQERLRREIASLEEELQDLYAARARDSAYEALQALDRRLAELGRQVEALRAEGLKLVTEARGEERALAAIMEKVGGEGLLCDGSTHLATLRDAASLAIITNARTALLPLAGGRLDAPCTDLTALAGVLGRLRDEVVAYRIDLQRQQSELQSERMDLDRNLKELQNRRRQYPAKVEELRSALVESMPGDEVRVLCELLEIPDERWQNAVEGYLNTQRFDLFVSPERFDDALTVYERVKGDRKIDAVGLVNSAALLGSRPAVQPGSLAEEVVTADPAARAYIDRLLGRVMKCATEHELKRFSVAITPTCMTYRNFTARQIEHYIYAVPYIGSRAIARQIELKEQRLVEVNACLEAIAGRMEQLSGLDTLVRGREPLRLAERWMLLDRLPILEAEIAAREVERQQVDTGALNAIQRHVETKEEQKREFGKHLHAAGQAEARADSEMRNLKASLQAAEATWTERNREWEQHVLKYPDLSEPGAARYTEALKGGSNLVIERNYRNNRQGLLTRAQELGNELYRLRLDYNRWYQFGGAPDSPDGAEYEQEHTKLLHSELPQYEEQIAQARQAAEEEFKEHFIFKLQENIHMARQEFESLNRVLKEIPFGQDRYQFSCAPDRAHRAFYDMIMDDFAMEGFTLFSLHFREKYGPTLDELFRLILDVPEERQAENIRKYTDYRTYLEFDIRIHHSNGETSSFSKVAREKSGGETQTPFYVAMIASFLGLYRPRQNQHSVRLLMFDEAFNRMDPDRAEQTLLFIRKLGLQLLAAAPTDKCEIIAPHVETTLLAIREGHRTWLEEYHQVLAAAPSPQAEAKAEVAVTGEGH